MSVAAIVVAGGTGTRAGGAVPKQYQAVAGQPVIRHSLEIFTHHWQINWVQPVIGADHEHLFARAAAGLAVRAPVAGGATRQASVHAGLCALKDLNPDYVLIHDAARPLASADLVSRVIAALARSPGVIPAMPVTDTLKRAPGSIITETLSRDHLWAAQTPQGFYYRDIADTHARAAGENIQGLTDDASVAEWGGLEVTIVNGEAVNRKLTTANDLDWADTIMSKQTLTDLPDIRMGTGYDVHAFEPGSAVILCGVPVSHDAKLKGHSDADVAMHALTDAILGALGEGDIGKHYPPGDEQWKEADSAIFLQGAADLVRQRGGMIAHADVTVICEAPKLRPHIEVMRARLADLLAIAVTRVSVKATTSEQLGFTGRREGIAAMAAATVRLPLA